jgi:hypothetical protein
LSWLIVVINGKSVARRHCHRVREHIICVHD